MFVCDLMAKWPHLFVSLVVGVHGVFCTDRLPVFTSVFLLYVYIG